MVWVQSKDKIGRYILEIGVQKIGKEYVNLEEY